MSGGCSSVVTLRALEGEPLADEQVRAMVVATSHAIAERQGVQVLGVTTRPDRIQVRLNVGRVESLGFAAELRRLTTAWYKHKFAAATLWGEPREANGEDDETA